MFLSALIPAALAATEGKVSSSSLVIREAASKNSKALQTLEKGDKLLITGTKGDWYKVKYGSCTGYVMQKYVKASGSVPSSGKTENTGKSAEKAGTDKTKTDKTKSEKTGSSMSGIKSIKDIGSAPKASRPGDSGSDVKKLQQALKLLGYYNGSIDGDYGDKTKAAVKAYQKAKHLTADGIAGSGTISRLFGTSAANDGKENGEKKNATEQLDWSKDNTHNLIPKGATFTVKDVKTGKTFTCRRWSGANHIDVEPATSSDAKTIKSIYGGEWSWKRRAILVKYNGHVYAASMNGMPHGTSTINNGFDGHFCIHFKNSKTHETKKVDPDHQAAVQSAGKVSW